MKTGLLLSALLLGQILVAQPSVKLYGFSQQFTPGNIPADVPEEGGQRKPASSYVTTQYFIYIAVSPTTDVKVSEIWIAGKWDTLGSQSIVTSPVTVEYPEKKTLVAATTKKVWQINPGGTIKKLFKPSASLQKMMKENQLIVAYSWKGKKYYTALKKLTVLPAFHGI